MGCATSALAPEARRTIEPQSQGTLGIAWNSTNGIWNFDSIGRIHLIDAAIEWATTQPLSSTDIRDASSVCAPRGGSISCLPLLH